MKVKKISDPAQFVEVQFEDCGDINDQNFYRSIITIDGQKFYSDCPKIEVESLGAEARLEFDKKIFKEHDVDFSYFERELFREKNIWCGDD